MKLFSLFCLAVAFASPVVAKPNVLFIAVDDFRPELGAYGGAHIKSPNIDQLAATGVRFDRAYVQMVICGLSRVSLLTGLRPGMLEIEDIDTFYRNTVPDVVTLPQLFKQQGYTSVYVGKVFHPGQTDDEISWSRRLTPAAPRGENQSEYQLPESRAIVKQWREEAVAKDLYDPSTLPLTDTPDEPKGSPAMARHSSFELRTRTGVPTFGPIDAATSRKLLHAYAACVSFVDAQVGKTPPGPTTEDPVSREQKEQFCMQEEGQSSKARSPSTEGGRNF